MPAFVRGLVDVVCKFGLMWWDSHDVHAKQGFRQAIFKSDEAILRVSMCHKKTEGFFESSGVHAYLLWVQKCTSENVEARFRSSGEQIIFCGCDVASDVLVWCLGYTDILMDKAEVRFLQSGARVDRPGDYDLATGQVQSLSLKAFVHNAFMHKCLWDSNLNLEILRLHLDRSFLGQPNHQGLVLLHKANKLSFAPVKMRSKHVCKDRFFLFSLHQKSQHRQAPVQHNQNICKEGSSLFHRIKKPSLVPKQFDQKIRFLGSAFLNHEFSIMVLTWIPFCHNF